MPLSRLVSNYALRRIRLDANTNELEWSRMFSRSGTTLLLALHSLISVAAQPLTAEQMDFIMILMMAWDVLSSSCDTILTD